MLLCTTLSNETGKTMSTALLETEISTLRNYFDTTSYATLNPNEKTTFHQNKVRLNAHLFEIITTLESKARTEDEHKKLASFYHLGLWQGLEICRNKFLNTPQGEAAAAIALIPEDQFTHALQLLLGIGQPRRPQEAVNLLHEISRTHPDIHVLLAWIYQKGCGITQNDVEAVRFYGLAADQGHANAQNNLAWMYQEGLCVTQNDVEAVRFYGLAADQGNAVAQNNLAWMHKEGRGVTRNDVEAVRLFRLAADQGDASAQSNLAWMYQEGLCVTQNDVEAVRFYGLAADQGNAVAQN